MLRNSNAILIVAGDQKSVFLEIFFKTLRKYKNSKHLILIVNKKILNEQMELLKFKIGLNEIFVDNHKYTKFYKNRINFINVDFRQKNRKEYLENSFNIALKLLKKNKKMSLINGPINKEMFLKGKYPGITEYLGHHTNKINKVVMLIFSAKLAVSPITTHIPLKLVHKKLTKKKIIFHVKKIYQFYKKKFNYAPKIAITGLNPHCESNFNSSEEKRIIIPAIKDLLMKNYNVSGPYPADTIFLENNYKKFDVIIGMYHDQVLAPIKSIFGFEAINITLGLPFLRVSPDHGPNVKMFGKNISNPNSLLEAIKFLDLK